VARADAQYCTGACRVAAHRKRNVIVRDPWWREYDEDGFIKEVKSFSDAPGSARYLNGELKPSRKELAEKLLEIASDEKPKTGRRFYYVALSYGYIRPSMGASTEAKKEREAEYGRINQVLGILRMQGLLDWDMVLDLTRELTEWQTYDSPREARAQLRDSYSEDRWLGQSRYPIFIVEKDTMVPVCEPIARRRQMPFASSRGYSSLRLQYDVAKMLKERWIKIGQTPLILFLSDLDPSGLDLQRAWQDAMRNFGVPVAFVRVGLTHDQVIAGDFQNLSIDVKPTDSRSSTYIDQHPDHCRDDGTPCCWEADILPDEALERAISDALRPWFDVAKWNQRDAEIERARRRI
jgi:hypothetical protein